MKKTVLIISLLMIMTAMTACGSNTAENEVTTASQELIETSEQNEETSSEEAVSEEVSEASAEEQTVETSVSENAVASGDETVAPIEVVEDGMEPIYADSLADGEYDIDVVSSSSMFNIEKCTLTVADGKMSAALTMGGTGYKYLFCGTGEEAVSSDESEFISFTEDENGAYVFTIPVEALDSAVDCAAYSKKKEKWYDRQLCFRASSLPENAFSSELYTTVEALGLSDGEYTVGVTLEGGSGRASVQSPAVLTVANGEATAEIIWSSPNYDFMMVSDERYDNIGDEEHSVFVIPVNGFDHKMPVQADTTAMSEPHLIDYTLYFDSADISAK